MERGKITLYISKDLKRRAKIKAVEEDTSVSAKVREWLERWIAEEGTKEKARRQHG